MSSAPRQRARARSGRSPWLVLFVVVGVAAGFGAGVLVGRHGARPSADVETAEPPVKKPAVAARRGGLTEPASDRPPQEKLTFYQTLTAPMASPPVPAAKSASAGKVEPAKVEPAKVEPAKSPGPTERPVAARPVAAPAPAASPAADRPAAAPAPARPAEVRAADWAVQVGAFKDRGQAENVRRPLAAAGFEAYVLAGTGDDGQPRYKVRVGTFKTREEAGRMAARVREERSLAAFVTAR